MVFCRKFCESNARLDGKTIIVTGCNCGIGKATVADFYLRGGRIVMACRNLEKAEAAKKEIIEKCKDKTGTGELIIRQVDLSSLESIRKFADVIKSEENRIDILVNNAGIMTVPYGKTVDGFEVQFGTNHLGPFLLTMLLLPIILQSEPARIVNLSSTAHTMGSLKFEDLETVKDIGSTSAYGRSKLSNILFTKELARLLKENNRNVNVYAVHPGVVKTELSRNMSDTFFPGATWMFKNLAGWMLKNEVEGAQTSIYCALDEKSADQTGLYYADCAVAEPSRAAKDMDLAKKLWDYSLEKVGLRPEQIKFN